MYQGILTNILTLQELFASLTNLILDPSEKMFSFLCIVEFELLILSAVVDSIIVGWALACCACPEKYASLNN